MAIYKFEFGDSDIRSTYAYLQQFLSMLVYNPSDQRTLDFFSEVTREDPGGASNRYDVCAYLEGVTRPALIFERAEWGAYDIPAIFFDGSGMGSEHATLVTSEIAPGDWPNGSVAAKYDEDYIYCSYDEETGLYTKVDPSTEYEQDTYYKVSYDPWYAELGVAGPNAEFDISQLDTPKTGYLTSKGAMLISRRGRATIIAKTSGGKIALVTPDGNMYVPDIGKASFTTEHAVMADGDTVSPILGSSFSFATPVYCADPHPEINEQTCLCPITTHRTDVVSNIVGAYCIPIAEHRTEGILEIGTTRYVTNGYFALEE